MTKHDDGDPVLVGFASPRNISMRSQSPEEFGFTWGEWREISPEARRLAINEYVYSLVEVWIEDDEDEATW